jgi:hypothetical protein
MVAGKDIIDLTDVAEEEDQEDSVRQEPVDYIWKLY